MTLLYVQFCMYNIVMTRKAKKTKQPKAQRKPAKIAWLHASVEDDLLSLAGEKVAGEPRWNRPFKVRIALRVDAEVLDWFKSKGPGYQTRMNRVLRNVMTEGKKRTL